MNATNIYDFVTEEKNAFLKPITLIDGWQWSMKDHIRRSILYKNSQFERDNENRDKRPFKNIIRPILNIAYRTEGFDVKDIELFINNAEKYFKSFLVKKYHEKWALDNALDTFIDDLVESYVDYGGVLVKNVNDVHPEVVDLSSIVFCNQHSILSRPFGLEHNMSPDDLREMESVGWGKTGATIDLEALITLTKEEQKKNNGEICLYEVHGVLPESWLKGDSEKGVSQMQIVAYYKNQNDEQIGVTLFRVPTPKPLFKFLNRDKIRRRSLGFGGIEELFEPQVWTNWSEVQIRELLEHASKIFYKTTDSRFKTRNNLSNYESGQVFDLQVNTDLNQIDNTPRNLVLFDNAVNRWEQNANRLGAASELFLGSQPTSGTPFKSVEAQLIEGKSLHQWRQGKIASFVGEIYRDWILPHIAKEIVNGQKFLSELSGEELQNIAQQIVDNLGNNFAKEKILSSEIITKEEVQATKDQATQEFLKGGRKRFIEILKNEFKKEDLDINANVAGKQKNLALLTDKIVNIIRQFIATPQIRQDPEMLKLLNVILESSGLSPIMFGGGAPMQPMQPMPATAVNPLQQITNLNKVPV